MKSGNHQGTDTTGEEPNDARVSRSVPWGAGGEVPPSYPTVTNSPEFETIQNFLSSGTSADEFMTSTQMCTYLNNKQADVIFNNITLGKALIRLGFKKTQKKINKLPLYGYRVKKLFPDPFSS